MVKKTINFSVAMLKMFHLGIATSVVYVTVYAHRQATHLCMLPATLDRSTWYVSCYNMVQM
jgi:hypothetical protein